MTGGESRIRPNREQQEEEEKEEKETKKKIIHMYTEGSEGEDEEHKT